MFIKLNSIHSGPTSINRQLISAVTKPRSKFIIEGKTYENTVKVLLQDGTAFWVTESLEEVEFSINPPGLIASASFQLWKLWDYYRP